MQETQVRSLGQEDPLEKETVTHSSTLPWKIPWMEEPGGLQFMGLQRVGHERIFRNAIEKNKLVNLVKQPEKYVRHVS